MADPSDILHPEQKAQEEYNRKIGLMRALYDDKLAFEFAAADEYGNNSLKLLTNMYGPVDCEWIDSMEFDDQIRNRLLAYTRIETVSTNAIAKSALQNIHNINRRLKIIQYLLIFIAILIMLNFFR